MAHHQGMALLSLAYVLLNRPMQRRFEADPRLSATVMLLQEKMPRNLPFYPHSGEIQGVHKNTAESGSLVRIFTTPHTPGLRCISLERRYHVMVSNSGTGYSRWNNVAVTRWREDPTADTSGTFCYIRDLSSGEFWSNGYQPTKKSPDTYQVIFRQARAEIRRKDRDFDTRTEIIVSPEDDVELRSIRVINRSWKRRTIEFTSYAEVVLALQASDETHRASAIYLSRPNWCGRKMQSSQREGHDQKGTSPWMLHLMTVHGTQDRNISFETDRLKFIGRGNSLSRPVAMTDSSTLSDTAGSVLDPIVAIRCTITLDPRKPRREYLYRDQ